MGEDVVDRLAHVGEPAQAGLVVGLGSVLLAPGREHLVEGLAHGLDRLRVQSLLPALRPQVQALREAVHPGLPELEPVALGDREAERLPARLVLVVQAQGREQFVVIRLHQADRALQAAARAEADLVAVRRPHAGHPALGRDRPRRDHHAGEVAVEHLEVHAVLGDDVRGEDLLQRLEVLVAHRAQRGRVRALLFHTVHGNLL